MSTEILKTTVQDYKTRFGIPYSFWIKKIGCSAAHFSMWLDGMRNLNDNLLKKLEAAIDENNIFNN